jgi:glucuronate isomerase
VTAVDRVFPLTLHPDRLFPTDPAVRGIARDLHEATRELPLICPHGHVDPRRLSFDEPFDDPVSMLLTPDHYVTRLLHAAGISFHELGLADEALSEERARSIWRLLCGHWDVYRGTAVRYWLESQLVDLFGVTVRPSRQTADAIYDQILTRLGEEAFRPRELYARFGIEVLATTDDPCDDLSSHSALAEDTTWTGRVIPTFRPDRLLEPAQPGWPTAIDELAEASGIDTGDYTGYLRALEQRRRFFVEHGATAADHSHLDARTDPLDLADAERIYRAALAGEATATEAVAFRRHMVLEMARMSCDDGLVMMLHPGVVRGHHGPTAARFGPDSGHDIPVGLELTNGLRPLLERFGTTPGFHLVVFTVDETLWSRELAPLAGFYPSVFAGAPWWFLDAPDAMRRFRAAIGETAGFLRTAGFVDDTRAFCTISARHDMSRRIDAGVLAQLVAEHRLEIDEALETAVDLVTTRPMVAFKL